MSDLAETLARLEAEPDYAGVTVTVKLLRDAAKAVQQLQAQLDALSSPQGGEVEAELDSLDFEARTATFTVPNVSWTAGKYYITKALRSTQAAEGGK